MADLGFPYEVIIAPLDDFEPEDRQPSRIDLAERRRIGYGLSEAPDATGSVPQDLNAIYIQSFTPQQQEAYGFALFGHADQPVSVELPDGSTVATNADGCLSEARISLYGDLKTWLRLDYIANNLQGEAGARLDGDERAQAVDAAWRTCLEKRGFDYASPGAAKDAIIAMYDDPGADPTAVLSHEIETAVADAECDQEVTLSETVHALRMEHLAQVQEERLGEILGYRELQAEALERAKELIGPAGS